MLSIGPNPRLLRNRYLNTMTHFLQEPLQALLLCHVRSLKVQLVLGTGRKVFGPGMPTDFSNHARFINVLAQSLTGFIWRQ